MKRGVAQREKPTLSGNQRHTLRKSASVTVGAGVCPYPVEYGSKSVTDTVHGFEVKGNLAELRG